MHRHLKNEANTWRSYEWYKCIGDHLFMTFGRHIGILEQERRIHALSVNINYGFTYSREHGFFKTEAGNLRKSIQFWEKEVEKR